MKKAVRIKERFSIESLKQETEKLIEARKARIAGLHIEDLMRAKQETEEALKSAQGFIRECHQDNLDMIKQELEKRQ